MKCKTHTPPITHLRAELADLLTKLYKANDGSEPQPDQHDPHEPNRNYARSEPREPLPRPRSVEL